MRKEDKMCIVMAVLFIVAAMIVWQADWIRAQRVRDCFGMMFSLLGLFSVFTALASSEEGTDDEPADT